MGDLYESNYRIFNHLQSTAHKPLASVAMHQCEDFTDNSLLQNAIRLFIENDIGSYTKMSLTDYLELPSDIAALILEQCQITAKAKGATLAQTEQQFKGLTR